MQTNPNIILSGNQMAQPRLPDVNAMMQTRTAGMENIYNIEQQRAEQAKAAQKEQEAAAVEAMLPSVVAAYSDPSDAGLDQAVALMPAEVRDTFAPFVSRLKTVRDPAARKAIIEAELAKDDAGRAVLDRVPTEIQRLNADVQRGQLDVSRRRLEFEQAEAGRPPQMTPYQEAQLALEREKLAAGGSSADYTTVETAQGIFLLNKRTGELTPATAGEGPSEAGAPPQALQPKPTPEKAEETKKRLADEKRAKDLDMAIAEVETVMKPGGLIDQSTGSYIGNLVDTAAAAVGVGTPGYIANAQLAPIADLVLKMVPRFEGPQSNLDVQSYKDAAGNLASPNVPNSVKMGAADTIVRLFKKYKGQFEYAPGEVGPEGGGNVIDFNDLGD
jgi:hypothetical protein